MKTVTLNIDHIVKAHQAIIKLLSQPGLDRKRVYWLDRNRAKLEPFVKEWFQVIMPAVQGKFMEDIPQVSFVPMGKYEEFKNRLVALVEKGIVFPSDELTGLFTKYEVQAKEKRGIPIEKGEDYQKEINAAVIAFEREVEYGEVVLDKVLEQLLLKLNGDEVVAIGFMFEEAGLIAIPSKGLIM